ncbi:MAG: cysteine hydrolase [Alphaproteobacteria bacterium]|nr:cysteine hydrolase [Alphaproteobacteria bacterium]
MHKIDIPAATKQRVLEWCGREHIFADIDPRKTAHVIVDLQDGFMAPGAAVEIPMAREIVPNVNKISAAVRAAGGLNVFIRYLIDPESRAAWSHWFTKFMTPERTRRMEKAFTRGGDGFELWPGLEVTKDDLIVDKTRLGAFVPGSSNLHEVLQARGIETLIITGTATNVCCESTARDAMQMNYQVIFVADGNATNNDAEHNATLNAMMALFADVMTTDEVVACLAKAAKPAVAAE